MKGTKSTLKKVIKEEIEAIEEQADANSIMDSLDQKLNTIIDMLKDVRQHQTGRRPGEEPK